MQPTFNLIDQPWIPCVHLDGRRELLGINAVLVKAHLLREIFDDSPLVTVTLHRLLLAILHRNFGPDTADMWSDTWKNGEGSFDSDALQSYFHNEQVYHRFDLFDAKHPFYQCSTLPFSIVDPKTKKDKSYATSVAKMATELAAGNNDTLFDHSVDDRVSWITPDQAARLVVASQGYSMGGRITFEKPEEGSADSSPLVKGAVAIARGANLFQTLMLNMCCYSERQALPFTFKRSQDKPAWERNEQARPVDRKLEGYLDLLTWQSRRIRLKPITDDQGQTRVRSVVMMKGEQFLDGFHRHGHETMVAFARNEEATEKQDPWPAVGFHEDRVLWRNSLALFQSIKDQRERPLTLDWLNQLAYEERLSASAVYQLDLFGLSSDQAKVLLWRHERLPLPLKLLSDQKLLRALGEALERCEAVKRSLTQSVWQFAKLLLLRDESKTPGTEQKKDIQKIVSSLGAEKIYWSSLDIPFRHFLASLSGSAISDAETTSANSDAILDRWIGTLQKSARKVFRDTVAREDSSARSLKATVIAERYFSGLLKKALSS